MAGRATKVVRRVAIEPTSSNTRSTKVVRRTIVQPTPEARATKVVRRVAISDVVVTVSGSFTLRSPGPGGFVAEASSFSGDIETCFGARPVATDKYGPGRRLDATVGKGEGRVRVKSMSKAGSSTDCS